MTGTRGLTFILVCILNVCLIFADDDQDLQMCKKGEKILFDEIFDEILEQAIEEINDPRDIPDVNYGDYAWYNPTEYKFSLTNGKLYGIKSLGRCLNTAGFASGEAAMYHLEPSIKADRLSVDYHLDLRYMTFEPVGTMKVTIENLRIKVPINVYEETNRVTVGNLDILTSNAPHVEVHTSNWYIPDWIFNGLSNWYINVYKDQAINFVEQKAKEFLASRNMTMNSETRSLIKGKKSSH